MLQGGGHDWQTSLRLLLGAQFRRTTHPRVTDYTSQVDKNITTAASPGRRLRDAWTERPLAVPGVFNALVARMAQRLGYQAVYLSGASLSAAAGVPDVGLL